MNPSSLYSTKSQKEPSLIEQNNGSVMSYISTNPGNDKTIKNLVDQHLIPFSINSNQTYKCPSIKSFQLPINDFKITDILKRHELTLPEIHKNKIVYDPLLAFQIEKQLPQIRNETQNAPMYCGRPLFSEISWRRRKMNIKKKKKYLKKMYYIIQKRKQNKEKRFTNIIDMFRAIHEKKRDLFDSARFINRELEKAKFCGYKVSGIYDRYRTIANSTLKSFDEKYFRTFVDPKKPVHLIHPEIKYKDNEEVKVVEKKVSLINKDKK